MQLVTHLHHALSWLYWSAQIHLWYAPYTVLLIVELLIGRRVRASWRNVAFNYAFMTSFLVIFTLINPPLKSTVARLASWWGGPYLDLTFGAHDRLLPNIAAVVIFLFIYDFFWYWWHRLQHSIPVLWAFHKLHHVDQNMGVTTTLKAHPIGELAKTCMVALPMALLFKLEPITIFWVSYSRSLFEHFVHMNVNCHFGRLNFVITSPNQHRVHHSVLPEHHNVNFATFFSIIDVVFGTYHHPGKLAPPTGVDTGETYLTLRQAYMQPFTDWWQMGKRLGRAVPQ